MHNCWYISLIGNILIIFWRGKSSTMMKQPLKASSRILLSVESRISIKLAWTHLYRPGEAVSPLVLILINKNYFCKSYKRFATESATSYATIDHLSSNGYQISNTALRCTSVNQYAIISRAGSKMGIQVLFQSARDFKSVDARRWDGETRSRIRKSTGEYIFKLDRLRQLTRQNVPCIRKPSSHVRVWIFRRVDQYVETARRSMPSRSTTPRRQQNKRARPWTRAQFRFSVYRVWPRDSEVSECFAGQRLRSWQVSRVELDFATIGRTLLKFVEKYGQNFVIAIVFTREDCNSFSSRK